MLCISDNLKKSLLKKSNNNNNNNKISRMEEWKFKTSVIFGDADNIDDGDDDFYSADVSIL